MKNEHTCGCVAVWLCHWYTSILYIYMLYSYMLYDTSIILFLLIQKFSSLCINLVPQFVTTATECLAHLCRVQWLRECAWVRISFIFHFSLFSISFYTNKIITPSFHHIWQCQCISFTAHKQLPKVQKWMRMKCTKCTLYSPMYTYYRYILIYKFTFITFSEVKWSKEENIFFYYIFHMNLNIQRWCRQISIEYTIPKPVRVFYNIP